ncbi:hypothetical protein ACLMJK_005959 [Lecanora helva]
MTRLRAGGSALWSGLRSLSSQVTSCIVASSSATSKGLSHLYHKINKKAPNRRPSPLQTDEADDERYPPVFSDSDTDSNTDSDSESDDNMDGTDPTHHYADSESDDNMDATEPTHHYSDTESNNNDDETDSAGDSQEGLTMAPYSDFYSDGDD